MRLCAILALPLLAASPDDTPRPPAAPAPRVLPGVRRDGFIQLANQWKLRPAGQQVELGDFPVQIQAHPNGRYVAVLHCGFREHEIVVVDLKATPRPKIVGRTVLDQSFYGLAFSPGGERLYASGGEFAVVHAFDFDSDQGLLSNHKQLPLGPEKESAPLVVGGVAVTPDGKALYAACPWGDAVVRVNPANPDDRKLISLAEKPAAEAPKPPAAPPAGGAPPSPPSGRPTPGQKMRAYDFYPYTCLAEPGGRRVFVSLWAGAAVAVIDRATDAVVATWPTESHPTEMALAPDGKALYVACSNSTRVSVLDPATGQPLQTINCALYPQAPSGNTPNSLCLSPDGRQLLIANADANNLAVFDVTDRAAAKPLGFIPTGWYPTSVRFHPATHKVLVANGKGTLPRANREGPDPMATLPANLAEYIAGLFKGTLSTIDLPTPERLATYTKQAYECSPLREDRQPTAEPPPGNPVPRKVGDPSPIKYVIYVIKENRTYDQVLGDVKAGNGDPSLCLFPEAVTPNHHKIARQFVLLDNFYVDGEVSADGHEWSMAAYATDFVEKTWPLTYRGSPKGKLGYPAEGNAEKAARPAGGYIWDRCREAGVSYRSYGEFIHPGAKPGDPAVAAVKSLEGHFDPLYHPYDLDYPDVNRAERFIDELRRFEQAGEMPRFQVMRLPNDHTTGTRVGKPTPTAMVADNDLALGMVVEALSRSKFWKETAVFVLEDDAQNGPDHVDAHRSPALVISPYTRRAAVDSTMYSTSSVLRTMELILGLQPMSQYDAAARPMYGCFAAKADLTPYDHEVPRVDLLEKNNRAAWGADRSEKFDLAKEDQADDLLFNEVIWKSVKGAKSPMPPPVRAAFVRPHADD